MGSSQREAAEEHDLPNVVSSASVKFINRRLNWSALNGLGSHFRILAQAYKKRNPIEPWVLG